LESGHFLSRKKEAIEGTFLSKLKSFVRWCYRYIPWEKQK